MDSASVSTSQQDFMAMEEIVKLLYCIGLISINVWQETFLKIQKEVFNSSNLE